MTERERTPEDDDIASLNDQLPTDNWNDPEPEADEPSLSGNGGEEDESEATPLRYGSDADDLAEQIAQQQIAKQEGRSKDFDGDLSRPDNTLGVFGEPDEDEPPAAPTQQQAPDQPRAQEDPMIELTIRGEKKTKPLSEVIRDAQMNDAAESYLTEARKVYDMVRAEQQRLARGEAPMTPEQNREAERGLSDEQRERRRQLHEVITYGTPEDIERAFEQFGNEVVQRATRETERQMRQRQLDAEIRADIEHSERAVSEMYPEIAQSETLTDGLLANVMKFQREIMARTVENLPDDVRSRFFRSNVTPDRLRTLRDPQTVMKAYVDFIRQGYTLPPVGSVFRESANYTADRLKLQPRTASTAQTDRGTTPANDPSRGRVQLSPERVQRKAELTPQTQRASAGPGRTSAPKAVTESDFHRQAMADYRDQGYVIPPRRK